MTLPIEKAQIAKTTAQWASAANVIGVDVIGIEVMDNGYNRYKRGDGVTAWASLPYLDKIFNQSSYSAAEIDAAVEKVIDGLSISNGGTGASDAYQALLNLGAAPTIHAHAYLPLTGGTVTGDTNFNGPTGFGSGVYLNGNPIYTGNSNTALLLTDLNVGANQCSFGFGTAEAGYKTAIYGESIDVNGNGSISIVPYRNEFRRCFTFGASIQGSMHSDFRPEVDATNQIGTSAYKFAAIYGYHFYYHSLNNLSDRRSKKDISDDISVYKNAIKRLQPHQFKYKENDEDRVHIGFIAQDVKAALEKEGLNIDDSSFVKVVDVEPSESIPDGKQLVVGYQEFTALNTAIIQDQQKKIEELEGRLDAIEAILRRQND